MIELLEGFAHDVVAVKARGVLNSDDYEQMLVPAIEAKLQDHSTIKLWYEFSEEFEGFSVEVLWDEAKLSFFHLMDFSRIAIICDQEWLTNMTKLLAHVSPCPLQVFPKQDAEQARNWLTTSDVS